MCKNKKLIFIIIVYSFLISFFYCSLSYKVFNAFSIKLNNVNTNIEFELPEKDSYVLSIWNPRLPQGIYFNAEQVHPFYISKKDEVSVAYAILPADYAQKGRNALNISGDGKYSLKICNYFGAGKAKNIFFLLNSSKFIQGRVFNFPQFIFIAFPVCLGLILILLTLGRLGVELFPIYCISYIPYFLCLCLFLLLPLFTPFTLVMSAPVFIVSSLLLIGMVKIPLLTFAVFKKYKSQDRSIHDSLPGALSLIISGRTDSGDALIFLFMCAIFFTAIALIFGLDIMGEFIINIAYVVLVTAVGIKIYKKLKK